MTDNAPIYVNVPNLVRFCLGVTSLFAISLGYLQWDAMVVVDYQPVVLDTRQRLVADPARVTPEHLDRLEGVLSEYHEKYERVGPNQLKISRRLWRDRDLLWNYTTKAGL